MATRCDCRWEPVELAPELAAVLLRAEEVAGCPAHAPVRAAEDSAI